MMAQKALLFKDYASFLKIMNEYDPRKQKALGRDVKNFNENEWDCEKMSIVVDGNMAKFTQNKTLKESILQTGNKQFVEASPTDRIWGIGLSEYSQDIYDESKWRGQNLLGDAITMVKDKIRENEKSSR